MGASACTAVRAVVCSGAQWCLVQWSLATRAASVSPVPGLWCYLYNKVLESRNPPLFSLRAADHIKFLHNIKASSFQNTFYSSFVLTRALRFTSVLSPIPQSCLLSRTSSLLRLSPALLTPRPFASRLLTMTSSSLTTSRQRRVT